MGYRQGCIRCLTAVACATVLLHIAIFVSGCEGDSSGSSDGGGGDSTLVGNVVSFSMGSAFYKAVPGSGDDPSIFAALLDLLVPDAAAAVGGVSVTAAGQGATTDGGGGFALSGLPSGEIEITFTLGGQSAILVVDVPPSTTIELRDITITDGAVNVGQVLRQEIVSSGGSSGSGPAVSNGFDDDSSSHGAEDDMSQDHQSSSP